MDKSKNATLLICLSEVPDKFKAQFIQEMGIKDLNPQIAYDVPIEMISRYGIMADMIADTSIFMQKYNLSQEEKVFLAYSVSTLAQFNCDYILKTSPFTLTRGKEMVAIILECLAYNYRSVIDSLPDYIVFDYNYFVDGKFMGSLVAATVGQAKARIAATGIDESRIRIERSGNN